VAGRNVVVSVAPRPQDRAPAAGPRSTAGSRDDAAARGRGQGRHFVRVEPQLQLQHIPLEKILEYFFLVEEKHAIHVQIFHEEIIFQDLLTSVPDISQMPGECGKMREDAADNGRKAADDGRRRDKSTGDSWLGRALWG
jgi:hypothetical protein